MPSSASRRGRSWPGHSPTNAIERAPALLDLLWEDFSGSLFTVYVKLWIAAADDRELYDRLAATERRIARTIARLATQSIGELQGEAGWEGRLLVALAAVRGLALTEHFEPRTEPQADPWPIARATLIELFATSQSRKTTARRERTRR